MKAHAYDLQITSNRDEDPLKVPNVVDVHLHLPAGGQKKVNLYSDLVTEQKLIDSCIGRSKCWNSHGLCPRVAIHRFVRTR